MVTGIEMDMLRIEGEKVKALNLIARILNENLIKINASLTNIESHLLEIRDKRNE